MSVKSHTLASCFAVPSNLSESSHSTAANDLQAPASFSTRNNLSLFQRIRLKFLSLQPASASISFSSNEG